MAAQQFSAIILAAGAGKRMKSDLPKVMCNIAGLPMLGHVIHQLRLAKAGQIILVLSPSMDEVAEFAKRFCAEIEIVIQKKPLGTADAVRVALPKAKHARTLIAYGDAPLFEAATYKRLASDKAALALSAFMGKARGYGRILFDAKNKPSEIVEDDSDQVVASDWLNAGLMAFDKKSCADLLPKIKNNNPKKEFYLTDLVKLAAQSGLSVKLCACKQSTALGANHPAERAEIEAIFQNRIREQMLAKGVQLTAPETVFFSWDTQIAAGVKIAPYIIFGVGAKIGKRVRIESFSHIAGATVEADAVIGPYARLRPEVKIGEGAYIGNFVEVKKTQIGKNTKASHLTYLGDAKIGKNVNIGAGTITCNYDGKDKHQTEIGDGVFVGSNTALVAPVKIGAGAYLGSGSVITDNVPPKSLALGRARQVVKKKKQKK